MTKSKTIAVVTTCRNAEKYLSEAIESVITQRGSFYINYIVVDCCSTDGTLAILEQYKEFVDRKIICNCRGVSFNYISESDSGMYEGLSKGFRKCRGDIACYINSDDFFLPNAFQSVINQFADNQVKWLTGLPCIFNEDGAILPSVTPCLYRSKLIRKGVYGRKLPYIQQESTFWDYGLFETIDFDLFASYRLAGDFYLWYNFSKTEELYTLNALLSGFRMHSRNLSHQTNEYKSEFDQIASGKISLLDMIAIFKYKLAFKLLGNNAVNYSPHVLTIENKSMKNRV